jgi:hypothetical protein
MEEFAVDVRGIDNLTPTLKRAETQVATSTRSMELNLNRVNTGFQRWGRTLTRTVLGMAGVASISMILSRHMSANTQEAEAFRSEMDRLNATLSGPIQTVMSALLPILTRLAQLPLPVLLGIMGAGTGASIGGQVAGPKGAGIGAAAGGVLGAGFGVWADRNPVELPAPQVNVELNNVRLTSPGEAQRLAREIAREMR